MNLGPLHWECGILPTGPPGKSQTRAHLNVERVVNLVKVVREGLLEEVIFELTLKVSAIGRSGGKEFQIGEMQKLRRK